MLLCFSSRGCSPLPPTCGPVRCAASRGTHGTVCLADLGSNHAHCRTKCCRPSPRRATPCASLSSPSAHVSRRPRARLPHDRVHLRARPRVLGRAQLADTARNRGGVARRSRAHTPLAALPAARAAGRSLSWSTAPSWLCGATSACPPANPIALGCSGLLGPPVPSRAALASPRRGRLLLPTPGAAASAPSWLGTSRGMSRSRPSQRSGSGTRATAGLTTPPPPELQRCEVERDTHVARARRLGTRRSIGSLVRRVGLTYMRVISTQGC